jgi:Bardet-Biedl syndrome 5 protein
MSLAIPTNNFDKLMIQPAKPEEAPILEEEVQEIDETSDEMSNAFVAYFADGGVDRDREPVYCRELGLAIERPKDGFTLQSLWEVIPYNQA